MRAHDDCKDCVLLCTAVALSICVVAGDHADGAQGVAASQRELQAYPNDWAVAADYGAGVGSDDGGMYVNHWCVMSFTGVHSPGLHNPNI